MCASCEPDSSLVKEVASHRLTRLVFAKSKSVRQFGTGHPATEMPRKIWIKAIVRESGRRTQAKISSGWRRGDAGRFFLKPPPSSAATGRPVRSWKAPATRSLERLRYVAHAFQRVGSGGFPASRWWYFQDALWRRETKGPIQGCPFSAASVIVSNLSAGGAWMTCLRPDGQSTSMESILSASPRPK